MVITNKNTLHTLSRAALRTRHARSPSRSHSPSPFTLARTRAQVGEKNKLFKVIFEKIGNEFMLLGIISFGMLFLNEHDHIWGDDYSGAHARTPRA